MSKVYVTIKASLSFLFATYLIYPLVISIIGHGRFVLIDEPLDFVFFYGAIQSLPIFSDRYFFFILLGLILFLIFKIILLKTRFSQSYPLFLSVFFVCFLLLGRGLYTARFALGHLLDDHELYYAYLEFYCGSDISYCLFKILLLNASFSIIVAYIYVILFKIMMGLLTAFEDLIARRQF